ncbi:MULTISPECIES: hypothetical protein [Pasteurellaceae]|uniref:Phage protein n=1 Tax=Haemophilus ducreyi (strain 35000HP / ATCC 700724) TaxID=233412 RepID=Q7VLB1_HAEDU|nr:MULTISPECIES: hypothetical protein [Pasteurellaceae]AAP96337.1 hypothetical protein HD_1553 [[Haemophilus] ducreyi 35000HP]AKO37031.1 hypothetical protein RZ61_06090 [[Haemophilus] ducreyi]AKO38502.1 hypothetical protein RZ62_06225 [[Haemophilus] ducreyi]AKO40041.1 hypothetical protein RZ63_06175 [[Haemophilus] ducreyi]AKO41514.1 hypothetical protein RZ64_06040 [[Haemophilus] ducreyi]
MIEFDKNKREHVRWLILLTLDHARPIGAAESLILSTIQCVPMQLTALELRRELDYLAGKALIEIKGRDTARWHAKLTSNGVDVVEYTSPANPGIARPEKYW